MGCLWGVFVVCVGGRGEGSRASRSKGLAWAPRDDNSRELYLEEAPGKRRERAAGGGQNNNGRARRQVAGRRRRNPGERD